MKLGADLMERVDKEPNIMGVVSGDIVDELIGSISGEASREVHCRLLFAVAKEILWQIAKKSGALTHEGFRRHFINGIFRSFELVFGIKNTGYNQGGVAIRDYWKFHGPYGLAYELHKKGLRAISITDPRNEGAKQLTESVLDTAVDAVSYGGFLYAEVKCRKEESDGN